MLCLKSRLLTLVSVAVLATACQATEAGSTRSPSGDAGQPPVRSPGTAPMTAEPSAPSTVGPDDPAIALQWMVGGGDGLFLERPDGTSRIQLGKLPGSRADRWIDL